MSFLRRQLAELLMIFVVPGIAALLPWPRAWRWLRWWASREGGVFDGAATAATASATRYIAIADENAFRRDVRMTWLIDYRDLLKSVMWRRRERLPEDVAFEGAWPQTGPFLAIGFHFGTCHWLFRSLAAAGHDSSVVSIRWQRSDHKGHPVRYWQGSLRYWDMQRIGGRPVAYRPGIKDKLAATLRSGATVIGLIDMPPRMAPRDRARVRLLDQEVSFPQGLITFARDMGVPVVPYWMEYADAMRTRRFRIGAALDAADADATLQRIVDVLDRQIRSAPAAWFFWGEWPAWIADGADEKGAAHDIAAAVRAADQDA